MDKFGEEEEAIIKVHAGEIKVNHAHYDRRADNICTVTVDLKSKYAEFICSGEEDNIPYITLIANEDTLGVDASLLNTATHVYFPYLHGWEVWLCRVSRYTAYICFVK